MKSILLIFLLTGLVSGGFAQSEVFTKSGEAIGGYDPVAYFKENKPVKGKTEFGFSWKGADWLFASDQNMEIFKANPEKFELVSKNKLGDQFFASPTIVGNRLYLRGAHGDGTSRREVLYCIGSES